MAPRRARNTRDEAERSFEQLYRGHRGDVYRAALRQLGNVQDAEDVTQAAFVDAYRAVLRGTRPQAPRAWLLAIAENVRRRRFRTSLRRPVEEPLDVDAMLASEEAHAEAGALLDALATLTAEQREAFLLREITGLSYGEIAERTDSTVASVQMLLFRARKTLREELEPPQAHRAYLPLASVLSRFEALSLTPRAVGAVGAAALAVGVSASIPAKADPPAPATQPRVATIAAAPAVSRAAPAQPLARSVPTGRKPRRVAPAPVAAPKAEPIAVASLASRPSATAEPQLQPQGTPEPRQQPASAPQQQPTAELPEAPPLPLPEAVTPPALPVATPAVPTPSLPPPPLPELVEPVLEGAGAAGAAGAGAPPLPVPPLDPLPPIP